MQRTSAGNSADAGQHNALEDAWAQVGVLSSVKRDFQVPLRFKSWVLIYKERPEPLDLTGCFALVASASNTSGYK